MDPILAEIRNRHTVPAPRFSVTHHYDSFVMLVKCACLNRQWLIWLSSVPPPPPRSPPKRRHLFREMITPQRILNLILKYRLELELEPGHEKIISSLESVVPVD